MREMKRALTLVFAGGAVAVAIAAVALKLPASDSLLLAGYAASGALITGLAGGMVMNSLRSRSIALLSSVAAITTVSAVALGAVVASQAMFISRHDLSALALVLVAAGTVGVAFAVILGQRVSSARRSLAETTRRIGAGDFSPAGKLPAPAEFAALADELEDMSERLQEAQERERALEASRRELVAWVSHDLRTPLAGIRAMAEALEDGVVTDRATVARYHVTIRNEVDRLAGLVDDLFELSRINAGSMRLEMERVSLGDLVSDALSAASGIASAKGVRLEGALDGRSPELELSAAEMGRVLRNLLENAIRHTPGDGVVHIETGVETTHAYVRVADECGGIAEDDIDRVFEAAFRGEAARTPGDGGGGLGLAIARGIVEAHEGEINVRNFNGGCAFTIRLPMLSEGEGEDHD
ncbi:MAG: HAMP domain-containing sensor histidine kinase [Actinomycetota bacterium]